MALKRENKSLRESNGTLVNVLDALKSMPKDDIAEYLKRLKSTDDQWAALSPVVPGSVHWGPLLPERMMARQVLPLVQSDVELELMVRHPFAYPTETSETIGAGILDGALLDGIDPANISSPWYRPFLQLALIVV